MFNYLNRLKALSVVSILLVALITSGCSVSYRHEVEAAGTEAKYHYGAGGFIRYDGYADETSGEVAGDFQVSSVDFKKPGSEVVLRFVGVVHIGDENYYKTLQSELLDTADVVLFEGVKVKGMEGKESGGDLHNLYDIMGSILGVSFQMKNIDYKRPNFVHCDVTIDPADNPLGNRLGGGNADQINQAVDLVGPISSFKDMLGAFGTTDVSRLEDALKHNMATMMLRQINEMTEGELFDHYRNKDDKLPDAFHEKAQKAAKQVKTALPSFPGIGGGMDEETKRFIIDERNAYVLEALEARLATVDHSKPQVIAIFYGAGHGPGIGDGIRKLGFYADNTVWLRAWSMNSRGEPHVAERINHKD